MNEYKKDIICPWCNVNTKAFPEFPVSDGDEFKMLCISCGKNFFVEVCKLIRFITKKYE